MSVDSLLEACPEYAKDLKLNLSAALRQPELSEQQIWGTAVCATVASRSAPLTSAVLEDAATHLTPTAMEAAKSAAALMGMNNIFCRFRHLSGNSNYETMPARLRMQAIRTHGADPVDFELWCLSASAINGCGVCVASHETALRGKGLSEESILAAVRIAAAIHGLAVVLDAR